MKYEKKLRVLKLLLSKAGGKMANRTIGKQTKCSHLYVSMIRREMGMPAIIPHDSDLDPMVLATKLIEMKGGLVLAEGTLRLAERKYRMNQAKIKATIKDIESAMRAAADAKQRTRERRRKPRCKLKP
jgi:hypothetical protein